MATTKYRPVNAGTTNPAIPNTAARLSSTDYPDLVSAQAAVTAYQVGQPTAQFTIQTKVDS